MLKHVVSPLIMFSLTLKPLREGNPLLGYETNLVITGKAHGCF
jgi:hypothetical protein